MTVISTTPFAGQKMGTSGIRKTVKTFTQVGYLENFIQSVFDAVPTLREAVLIIGGDGRFYNDVAIQIILRMAAANGVARVIVGAGGIMSTPACSHLIRRNSAAGGFVLSASHNPGGPDGDFGIKLNLANGGPAPESVTAAIYAKTQGQTRYKIGTTPDIDLSKIGEQSLGAMRVDIIDPVADYLSLMESLFDFPAIKAMIKGGFTLQFDAMHAVTGPYARAIFESALGAKTGSVINARPLPDFGGGHPDPNPVYAKPLFDLMFNDGAPDFGAASDGDGDRNIVLGRGIYISPSDSLAVLTANAHLVPAYAKGIKGAARSMPTSRAVDRVAAALGVPIFETPTGWKFFGNLLGAGKITLCGEESAGASSDHVREKDGIWAVLMWLNIVAARGQSVAQIMQSHWRKYGRNYYMRHDYEAVDPDAAAAVMAHISAQLPALSGQNDIEYADNFTYIDPIDKSISENQGLRIVYKNGSRIVFRLSGTGTIGATLRIYLERYVSGPDDLDLNPSEAILPLVNTALDMSNIATLTGRGAPSVIS